MTCGAECNCRDCSELWAEAGAFPLWREAGDATSGVENVIDECGKAITTHDLSTGAARGEAVENAGRCAADALCEYYSGGAVPPGVCGSVVGPVISKVVDVWNDIFGGGDYIDWSKASLVTVSGPRLTATVQAIVAANVAIAAMYDVVWNAASVGVLWFVGGSHDKADQFYLAHPELAYQNFSSQLDMTKPESGLVVARATEALDASYQRATHQPSVLPPDFTAPPPGVALKSATQVLAAARAVTTAAPTAMFRALQPPPEKQSAAQSVVRIAGAAALSTAVGFGVSKLLGGL